MRAFLLIALVPVLAAGEATPPRTLPRFTEEREVAARHFVGKNLPDLLPLLDELKKASLPTYQREIRGIFQATELLAELQGDPVRYNLELRIWKAEQLAATQVARLATGSAPEPQKAEAALKDLAKELVELDLAILELKADRLERELSTAKEALTRGRDQMDRDVRGRYESLLEQARKREK
jgi:hypothetical protein